MTRSAWQLFGLLLALVALLSLVSSLACRPTPPATPTPPSTPTVAPTPTPPAPPPTPLTPTPTGPPPTPPTPAPTPQAVTVDLTARSITFDKDEITVPAGARVTIVFHHEDAGIPHNFAAYEAQSGQRSIYVGEFITGPQTAEFTFDAPSQPGTYYYQCDVHPFSMTGKLIVTP